MGSYAVGDIHGCFDEWIEFKNKIEYLDKSARFILVGDIVDRGPKENDMIGWALKNITKTGKYRMIIGNHEYDRWQTERKPIRLSFYMRLPFYIDEYINGRRFIIVHSYLPDSVIKNDGTLKANDELSSHEMFSMVWSRNLSPFYAIPGATVIQGHNPTVFEDSFRPEDYSVEKIGRAYDMGNRINIDCGLVYKDLPGHRLAAIRLDDMEIFYNDDLS